MKRTQPWVWIVAIGCPLAALVLWFALRGASVPARARPPRPEAQPEPAAPAEPKAAEPPAVPLFGPPPHRPAAAAGPVEPTASALEPIPGFIAEAADATAQIVRGAGANPFVIGFYSDGTIRFVDPDGSRYAGKAESARARMREVGGTRAFTVQIGVGADGGLQATFTGGMHDTETLALVPLVGWSIA
jgi:hypothetical protein